MHGDTLDSRVTAESLSRDFLPLMMEIALRFFSAVIPCGTCSNYIFSVWQMFSSTASFNMGKVHKVHHSLKLSVSSDQLQLIYGFSHLYVLHMTWTHVNKHFWSCLEHSSVFVQSFIFRGSLTTHHIQLR